MNDPQTQFFVDIKTLAGTQGPSATLDKLAQLLRDRQDYHQLFEALKMRIRHQLGMPILYEHRPVEVDPELQDQLEQHLLEACKEVGTLLVQDGKLREGWIYLQPVGDAKLNRELIEAFPVQEDNLDEIIDVSLMQLAAPDIGFSLVLNHYGTCNAITTYDSSVHSLDSAGKRDLAKLLVSHLYRELKNNLVNFLNENQVEAGIGQGFLELIRANKRLLSGAGPMTDATHLSSAMRIGRCLTDPESLRQLAEMAEYGCQLAEPFHFPGDPPFEKTYRDHLTFYRALSADDPNNPDVNHAIQFFDQKSRSSASDQHNPVCDEVYVDLLVRLGQFEKAIEASLERLSRRSELTGLAPPVHQIARQPDHFSTLEQHYQSQQDLLGFTVSVLLQNDELNGEASSG